jgi:hypothetical protein
MNDVERRPTSSHDVPVLSEALLALVNAAAESGLSAMRGGSFAPYALLEGREGRQTLRFVDFHGDGANDAAARLIRDRVAELERYVLASRGIVTFGDEACETLILDAGERGPRAATRYGQRIKSDGKSIGFVPGLLVLSRPTNLLEREEVLLVVCPRCDAKNRVALSRIRSAEPRCGACKMPLAS